MKEGDGLAYQRARGQKMWREKEMILAYLLFNLHLVQAYRFAQPTPLGQQVITDDQFAYCNTDHDCGGTATCEDILVRHFSSPRDSSSSISTFPTLRQCSCSSASDCPRDMTNDCGGTYTVNYNSYNLNYEFEHHPQCICYHSDQCGPAWICAYTFKDYSGDQGNQFEYPMTGGVCMCDPDVQGYSGCNGIGKGRCVQGHGQTNVHSGLLMGLPSGLEDWFYSMHANGIQRGVSTCDCNTVDGWTGHRCDVDMTKVDKCNGRGEPVCDDGSAANPNTPTTALTVYSLNTGKRLGANCTLSYTHDNQNLNRGGSGTTTALCQCELGWFPDYSILPGSPACSTNLPCGLSGTTDTTTGRCACTGDAYLVYSSGIGICQPGCGADVCNGHGSCFGAKFNDQCDCAPGWATDPVIVKENGFAKYSYCSVPVEVYQGVTYQCGFYGFYNTATRQCQCSIAGDNSYFVGSGQTSTALLPCLSRCLAWDTISTSSVSSTTPNGQLCGGDARGSCQADAHGGTRCACRNGFRGSSCAEQVCPVVNGGPCSGNGVCDMGTGVCLCGAGFVGVACELRVLDCAAGQVVKSYPPASAYTFTAE